MGKRGLGSVWPTPGGDAAASAGTYLSASDFVLITGAAADAGSNLLSLTIPADADVFSSGGLNDAEAGGYWEIPADKLHGAANLVLEWGTIVNRTVITLGFHRADTAPTTLAELESATVHYLQLTVDGAGRVSHYLKNGTNNFSTGTAADNSDESTELRISVQNDANGWGGSATLHTYGSSSRALISATRTTASGTKGFVSLTWTPWNAESIPSTPQVKIKAPGYAS